MKKFAKEENAVSAVEYGLLLAFIALGIFTGLQALGNKLSSNFASLSNSLTTASQGGGGVHPPPASPFM